MAMAFFPDLTPYTYFRGAPPGIVNIGWLDFDHAFPTGKSSLEFRAKLIKLCKQPVMRTRGLHFCSACKHFQKMEQELEEKARADGRLGIDIQELRDAWNQAHKGVPPPLGSAEIRVPGKDEIVYAAPEMIAHYVIMHDYCPPQEFIDAVFACDECVD
jgi:hypothetical protein